MSLEVMAWLVPHDGDSTLENCRPVPVCLVLFILSPCLCTSDRYA